MRHARTVAALAAALLALTGCSTGDDAVRRGTEFFFVAPGGKTTINYEGADRQKLPVISGEDLFDENKTISTADFAGKVLVINIWGQWCGPCRREAPELQKVAEQAKGVQVLGIDVRDEHSRENAQDFLRDRGLTYPSIHDKGGRSLVMLRGYPRNVVPSTIVLDKQQRVAVVFLKELLAEDLLPVVKRLAAE